MLFQRKLLDFDKCWVLFALMNHAQDQRNESLKRLTSCFHGCTQRRSRIWSAGHRGTRVCVQSQLRPRTQVAYHSSCERERRAYFADSLQNLFTADRYCLRTALFLPAEVSQIMHRESIADKCVRRFSVSSDAAVWIFNPVLHHVLSADAEVLSARLWSWCSVNLNEWSHSH